MPAARTPHRLNALPGTAPARRALALVLATLLAGIPTRAAAPAAGARSEPLPPAEAARTFQTDPGLALACVAAEPLVRSPAALAWDEHARLFVAENPGYPVGPGPGQPPQGRIVELLDADGDGRADGRVEFADALSFPNGLLPWRGGWLVTDAPHLWWLADTNRDGRADTRELWFTGFATNQTTQLRACYPTLGPDGWIYVARGWSAGVVTSPKWPALPPVDLRDGDFRFRPDGSRAEAIGGNAQFGMVLDDVGRRFTVSNRNPLMHAVVHRRWWLRHPGLAATDLVQDVSPAGYEARVRPRSPDSTTAGFMAELLSAPHAGSFTAACGIHAFHGPGLPAEYQGGWFLCEPAQNLVQRQVATPAGPTFRSQRVDADREVVASTDPWFRPVFAATGPDGALYLADFHRKVLDHPDYLPAEVRGRMDFETGKDLGRIWRLHAPETNPRPLPESLATLTPAQLAVCLASPNGWVRQTAHRLLLQSGHPEAWTAVHHLATHGLPSATALEHWNSLPRDAEEAGGADPDTLGQARRLWLLTTLPPPPRQQNQAAWVPLLATFSPSPTLRETGWRVWQTLITDPKHALPDVPYDMVYAWADDPNPAVRFQFALVCGEQQDWTPVVPALARIARRDGADRWTRTAVLSGLRHREAEFARELLRPPVPDTPALAAVVADLARLLAAQPDLPPGRLADFLDPVLPAAGPPPEQPAWTLAALGGTAEGLRRRGAGSLAAQLRALAPAPATPPRDPWPDRLAALAPQLFRQAADAALPDATRVLAVGLLAELDSADSRDRLLALLDAPAPAAVQVAAVRALALSPDAALGAALVEPARWAAAVPAVRTAVLAALTGQPALLPALLDAIESGRLPVWVIEPQRRNQLQNHPQPALRDRARRLLAEAGGADRRKVLADRLPLAARKGSGTSGHAVFLRACSPCHQLAGEGAAVGPDLSGLRNQPPEALLLHILVPDAEVAPGYEACEVEAVDGTLYSGLLASENAETITLRVAGGRLETLRRAHLRSVTRSRTSLMPQELEKTMTDQELADLLAFLRGQP